MSPSERPPPALDDLEAGGPTLAVPPPTSPPEPGWLEPHLPGGGVRLAMSLRDGGVSAAPWSRWNLGDHVGDAPEAVAANRRRWAEGLAARGAGWPGGPAPDGPWLRQVHGTGLLRWAWVDGRPRAVARWTGAGWQAVDEAAEPAPVADAALSTEPGLPCTVLVADCLPVLLAAPGRTGVAAAHAGWRGLAAGVLETAVAALAQAAACPPAALRAWIGPGLGPEAFEVGADVLQAFGVRPEAPGPRFRPGRTPDRWWADLPGLAEDRLRALGLAVLVQAGRSTHAEPAAFFSHRRDGRSGRHAAALWIEPDRPGPAAG